MEDLPDNRINTTDIPEIPDWSDAKRGGFHRPVKLQITLRLDADINAWFKARTRRLRIPDGHPWNAPRACPEDNPFRKTSLRVGTGTDKKKAGPYVQIRWEGFEHRRHEDRLSVLLRQLHPDSQRIDGKGGDEGRGDGGQLPEDLRPGTLLPRQRRHHSRHRGDAGGTGDPFPGVRLLHARRANPRAQRVLPAVQLRNRAGEAFDILLDKPAGIGRLLSCTPLGLVRAAHPTGVADAG